MILALGPFNLRRNKKSLEINENIMRGDKIPKVRGNWWKYPFCQKNVGKKSVNNSGLTVGSQQVAKYEWIKHASKINDKSGSVYTNNWLWGGLSSISCTPAETNTVGIRIPDMSGIQMVERKISANTSTWYRYPEKIQYSPYIRRQIPRRSGGYSSLRIKFELLIQNSAFTICASYFTKKWFIFKSLFVWAW